MRRCTSTAGAHAEDALAPTITANALGYRCGKHYDGYVDSLNKLAVRTPLASLSLEKLIAETSGKADKVAIFNGAAQA